MRNKEMLRILLLVVFLDTYVEAQDQKTFEMNMDSYQCDDNQRSEFQLSSSDKLRVFATPPQTSAGEATRDSCTAVVRGNDQPLIVYVLDIRIFDCGTKVEIFDGSSLAKALRVLRCNQAASLKIESKTPKVTIRLVKQSPSANNFRLRFIVTTRDYNGPPIAFETIEQSYNQDALSPGAIAGLTIAGTVVFLALLGIAIYCIVKQRKKRKRKESQAQSSIYSSNASKVLFPAHTDRYQNSQDGGSRSSTDSSIEKPNYVYTNPNCYEAKDGRKRYGSFSHTDQSERDGKGYYNQGYDSTESSIPREGPRDRKYSKNSQSDKLNGSLSRNTRSGSARSRSTSKRRKSANGNGDGTDGSKRRSRSSSSPHRRSDSSRSRSRSQGGHGSQGRSSRPHSSDRRSGRSGSGHHRTKHTSGRNYPNISSMSEESKSNSSTSSREEDGTGRHVSYDLDGRRHDRRNREADLELQSQV